MAEDFVDSKIREVEQQIDTAYQANYLATLNFAEAAWYLLAAAEDSMFIPLITDDTAYSAQNASVSADRLLTHIQYPLSWLWEYCPKNGKLSFAGHKAGSVAALELLKMAASYKSFVAAFVYASKGMLSLSLKGTEIIATHDFLTDTRYEAYSRLLKARDESAKFSYIEILEIVKNSVKVNTDRFSYKLTPKLVEKAKALLRPVYETAFRLPPEWEFSRYTLTDYFEFTLALASLAVLHTGARHIAAINGCIGAGYFDSLGIFEYEELVARIIRYSHLPRSRVVPIIEDLIYGNQNIKNPDPALQPLIPITKNKLAVAPWIILTSDFERNFTVLMNRMPPEKKIYNQLVNEKEAKMRSQISDDIAAKPYRTFYGLIPQDNTLPDIDLAIISDTEKVCLILELKWFIDPADINEIITRSEDLSKGVSQLKLINEKIKQGFMPVFDILGIDASYTLAFAVTSANWIGFARVQDPNIPIINQKHLVRKLQFEVNLSNVVAWLNERKYLPVEGRDYSIVQDPAKILDWKLTWYSIKPLVKTEFLPL